MKLNSHLVAILPYLPWWWWWCGATLYTIKIVDFITAIRKLRRKNDKSKIAIELHRSLLSWEKNCWYDFKYCQGMSVDWWGHLIKIDLLPFISMIAKELMENNMEFIKRFDDDCKPHRYLLMRL